MLNVFLNVILPIFLVAVLAAIFYIWRKPAVGPLNQTALYLLNPALIFSSLVNQELSTAISFRVTCAAVLITFMTLGLSLLFSLGLRHPRPMQSAFMLSTIFPNAGNMGLPILLLAFGPAGLGVGVVIFVAQAIIGSSLGIFVAARSQMKGRDALLQVFKLPAVYAMTAALLVRASGLEVPFVIEQPISLLAAASIPVMLVVLGFQLGSGVQIEQLPSLGAALLVRLVLSVPLAYLATLIFGLEGTAQGALIVISAMPAAVFGTVLATEFHAVPRFVTGAVVTSTLVSVATLTIVITIVQRWL